MAIWYIIRENEKSLRMDLKQKFKSLGWVAFEAVISSQPLYRKSRSFPMLLIDSDSAGFVY